MKKVIMLFFLLITFSALDVSALSCSSTENLEIKKAANQVQSSYDVEDNSKIVPLKVGNNKTTYTIPNYIYKINIYNIKDDIYVVLSNDVDNVQVNVSYEDTKNGVYTYEHYDYSNIYNYKLSIYSNRVMCKGDLVGTKKITTPKYNPYSEYEYCKTSSEDFCKKFVKEDFDFGSNAAFLNKVAPPDTNPKNKALLEQIKDHKKIIIIVAVGTALIALAYVVLQEMLRRRYDKEI